jgi:GAF domain-containing protein
MMLNLREGLASMLAYEDVSLLAQDLTSPDILRSFLAIAPNTLAAELSSSKRSPEFYYYNPNKDCLSMKSINQKKASLYNYPRDIEGFHEGLDNLSPLGQLRELIIAPLLFEGNSFGVIQFINKKRGAATSQDLEVAQDMGDLIGNYLGITMGNLALKMAVDRVADGFRILRSQGALVGSPTTGG